MKRKNKEGRENDLRKEEIQLKNISVNFAGYTYVYILFIYKSYSYIHVCLFACFLNHFFMYMLISNTSEQFSIFLLFIITFLTIKSV